MAALVQEARRAALSRSQNRQSLASELIDQQLMPPCCLPWQAGARGVPAYASATLVDENGQDVLLVVAVTTIISVIVWIASWWGCSHEGHLSG
jgi:hypothetical protein